jgi:hypothetical protein
MYERKHVTSAFLVLVYFTYHDVLQLHPFVFVIVELLYGTWGKRERKRER